MKTVAISGGFDPIHRGHVRLIEHARSLGDYLIIILNNDNWLRKKKGKVFMDEQERKEVLMALRGVDAVYISHHDKECQDMSVTREIDILRPSLFANGGDRSIANTPEKEVCDLLQIEMVYNIGGDKIQSSSKLLQQYA